MPEGGTIQQLNDVILKVERAISNIHGVEMFRTSIDDSRNGEVLIYFKDDGIYGDLPFILKNQLENLLLDFGGVNWSVSGVGRGFSNSISDNFRDESIILEGYNYNKLREYAERLRVHLSADSRVQDAEINSDISGATELVSEYTAVLDKTKLSLVNSSSLALSEYLMDEIYGREVTTKLLNKNEAVYLTSDVSSKFSIWDFNNSPILLDSVLLKADQMSSLFVEKRGGTISKRNQQYQLAVTYDFIGPFALAKSVKELSVARIRSLLPLGYTAFPNYEYKWNIQDRSQYLAIIIAILLTYIISSIALESLLKSMLVIYVVMISFIGIFVSFYLFDINFDQGGVMSFVFIVAITGGLGTTVIKDFYNPISYSKFLNRLVTIGLACAGIVCGVFPFILIGSEQLFWKSFAVGTMGGIVFFIAALIVYMPPFFFQGSKNKYSALSI
jgi:multidrug efflux pump subunit AcrB